MADQRGLARTVVYPGKTAPTGGDHTDIGATELQAVTVTGVSPSTAAPGATVQITGSISPTPPRIKFGSTAATASDQFTYAQQSTTSTTTPTTTTTSTTSTATVTTPMTTAPATPPKPPTPPVQPRITGVSASGTTIVWCRGAGCRHPAPSLQFSLNRATTNRLVLRTRPHGHYKQVAITKLHGHQGINHDRIAGRWHGHLYPTGPVQILVQIQHDHHWEITNTIALTVRHSRRQA